MNRLSKRSENSENRTKKKSHESANVKAQSSGPEGWALTASVSLVRPGTSLNLGLIFFICKTKRVSFITSRALW